jgi:hypothetical protein
VPLLLFTFLIYYTVALSPLSQAIECERSKSVEVIAHWSKRLSNWASYTDII